MKARTITIGKATPDPRNQAAGLLAAAVLVHGVKDAKAGNPQAIYWLHTASAAFYARLAGHDDTGPLVKLATGCKPKWIREPWQVRHA